MKIIIDDAAIQRALGKYSARWVHKQIQEIREFFEIPETEAEPKYDDTAERDYIAYCDGLSGGSEKYTTVRQCAARTLGVTTAASGSILTIDEVSNRLDQLTCKLREKGAK